MLYPVNDIYPCVQGEGVMTGVAMVLVRLQGCSVRCSWCDTKETWELNEANKISESNFYKFDAVKEHSKLWTEASGKAIAFYIASEFPGPKWVLITGGEPAQYDLTELVNCLHDQGYKVALETSGTEQRHLNADFDWVCVSPKIDMPGGKMVLRDVLEETNEIKMVVGKPSDLEKLEHILRWTVNPEICLQPVSQSEKATQLCIDEVIKRGWRLSIQMHKYIGVK